MTVHDDYLEDFKKEASDPQVAGLISDLESVFAATPPAHLRASIVRTIEAHSAERMPRRSLWPVLRLRVAAIAGVLAIALTGLVTFLSHQGIAPVAAQTILNRAVAASRLSPQQAAHLIYSFPGVAGKGGGVLGPMDVWLHDDAHGTLERVAISSTIFITGTVPWKRIDSPVAAVERLVADSSGGQAYVYDPQHNEIARMDAPGPAGMQAAMQMFTIGGLNVFDAPAIATYLQQALAGAPAHGHLLPQQTLDGHTVDVIQFAADPQQDQPPMTVYVDSQSYLLRGWDMQEPHYGAFRMRITHYSVSDLSAVPANTFTLNAPLSARVVPNVQVPEFVPGD